MFNTLKKHFVIYWKRSKGGKRVQLTQHRAYQVFLYMLLWNSYNPACWFEQSKGLYLSL